MASQTFNNFKNYANQLEAELGIKYDAKPYKDTIRVMLDGYCKAMDENDEHLKNLFISGLILRHWDKVKKLADSCPNIDLKGEEFVDWVYEAIMLACEYRKWQKDESVNAQQCINQCIETIRVRHYYEYNLDKHKANYSTVSLETPVGDEGDNGVQKTLMDTMYDEEAEEAVRVADGDSTARHIVQMFINKNRIVEAIIMDIIAFGDTEKVTKHVKRGIDENGEAYKYTTYTREFWKFKAVQLLSNLPEDYQQYFLENYLIKTAALDAALDVLKRANNSKLYRELDKSLSAAKTILQASI
jgi:hypothetical protein